MAKLLLLIFLILPTQQTIINYVNEMNLESYNVFTINKDSNSDFVRLKRDTTETSTKSPATTPPSKKGLPSSIDNSIGKIIPKVIICVIFFIQTFWIFCINGEKSVSVRMQVRFYILIFFV